MKISLKQKKQQKAAKGVASTLKRAYTAVRRAVTRPIQRFKTKRAAETLARDIPWLKNRMKYADEKAVADKARIAQRIGTDSELHNRVRQDLLTREIVPPKMQDFKDYNEQRLQTGIAPKVGPSTSQAAAGKRRRRRGGVIGATQHLTQDAGYKYSKRSGGFIFFLYKIKRFSFLSSSCKKI